MVKALLHPAFVWDCDECGQENFERAVRAEMSEDELAEMKMEFGYSPDEEGEFLHAPEQVTCRSCGTEYEIEDD